VAAAASRAVVPRIGAGPAGLPPTKYSPFVVRYRQAGHFRLAPRQKGSTSMLTERLC
jgi:hypothetical protein